MAFSLAHSTLFSKPSILLYRRSLALSLQCSSFSTSAASLFPDNNKVHRQNKSRQPVAASLLELGGVKIAREGKLSTILLYFP